MSIFIKVLVSCLLAVVLGLFATGIERIVWMFSRNDMFVVLPKDLYKQIEAIQCDRPAIEVKRDADGVLRYRCGTYWLLSHGERSLALSEGWPEMKRQLAIKQSRPADLDPPPGEREK